MSEEDKGTSGDEESQKTTTKTEGSEERTYGQADVDAIMAKVKRDAEKERDAAKAELERLKQKSMTDDEKRIAEAKAAGAQEAETKFSVMVREGQVEKALMMKGITDDAKLKRLARLVDAEADPVEAVEALSKDMPELFTKTNLGGLGGRNPGADDDNSFTEEYAGEMIQKHGPQWLTVERKKKLDAYRAQHATIRRL